MEGEARVSVCVVSGRRHRLLEIFLRDLLRQRDPPEFELLVCANGDPSVEPVVKSYFPNAIVFVIERVHPGAARNILIENAQGDLLMFLDDDVTLHRDLLRRLASLAASVPEAMVFGGPNVTPPRSTRFQRVQGAVLASLVASGPVRRRYGRHPAGPADERFFMLCNLAVRRPAMDLFDTELVCAEENALLMEMSARGLRMHYDPDLVVYHERRSAITGFAGQLFKYGRGRGQIIGRYPSSIRPAYLAPMLVLPYVLALPLLVVIEPLTLLPLIVYGATVVAGAARVGLTMGQLGVIPLAALFIVMVHLCYAAGIYRGLVSPGKPMASVSEPIAGDVEEKQESVQ